MPASSAQAGVRVTSMRYNGTIHDFVLLNAIAETPATRSAIAVAMRSSQVKPISLRMGQARRFRRAFCFLEATWWQIARPSSISA
ncbi:hypothetical protein EV131_11071 [Rhizobium laguerreae]|uniref:Uncharacterized protein n=1 Tax=Rhizobium laguerreae TaxID=1076926 RepID=A0AAX2QGF4_9HYPH|nr:hypothetical protein EV131_11071 [Rhizobium laguerreae]